MYKYGTKEYELEQEVKLRMQAEIRQDLEASKESRERSQKRRDWIRASLFVGVFYGWVPLFIWLMPTLEFVFCK